MLNKSCSALALLFPFKDGVDACTILQEEDLARLEQSIAALATPERNPVAAQHAEHAQHSRALGTGAHRESSGWGAVQYGGRQGGSGYAGQPLPAWEGSGVFAQVCVQEDQNW